VVLLAAALKPLLLLLLLLQKHHLRLAVAELWRVVGGGSSDGKSWLK
jgi:hypothetical protein